MDYCKNAVGFTCSPFGKKNQGQSSISCLTGHPQPLGMFESGGPLAHSLACRRHLETDLASQSAGFRVLGNLVWALLELSLPSLS